MKQSVYMSGGGEGEGLYIFICQIWITKNFIPKFGRKAIVLEELAMLQSGVYFTIHAHGGTRGYESEGKTEYWYPTEGEMQITTIKWARDKG